MQNTGLYLLLMGMFIFSEAQVSSGKELAPAQALNLMFPHEVGSSVYSSGYRSGGYTQGAQPWPLHFLHNLSSCNNPQLL